VALAVEMLLDRIMIRMDEAVEEAFSPGHRGRTVHLDVTEFVYCFFFLVSLINYVDFSIMKQDESECPGNNSNSSGCAC